MPSLKRGFIIARAMIILCIFLIMALFFIISSDTSSAIENVYDGWLHHEDVFSAAGHDFRVKFANSEAYPDIITLRADEKPMILSEGDCKDWRDLVICFTELSESVPLENQFERWKVHITIGQYMPKISMRKEISKKTLFLEESFTVNITLNNSGDEGVSEAEFKDEYDPEDFYNYGTAMPCSITGSSVIWRGNLGSGNSIVCTYRIKPRRTKTSTITSSLSYMQKNEKKEIKITDTIIVKNTSISYSFLNEEKNASLEKPFNASFILENRDSSIISRITRFEVFIPYGLYLSGSDGFLESNVGRLEWKGNITAGNKKSFLISVIPTLSGNLSIGVQLEYEEAGFKRSVRREQTISVNMVMPAIDAWTVKPHYEPGEEGVIRFRVTHPEDGNPLYMMAVSFDDAPSWISGPQQMKDEVLPGKKFFLDEVPFTAPLEDYNLSWGINFRNEEGQHFTVNGMTPVRIIDKKRTSTAEDDKKGILSDRKGSDRSTEYNDKGAIGAEGKGETEKEKNEADAEKNKESNISEDEKTDWIMISGGIILVLALTAYLIVKIHERQEKKYEERIKRMKEELYR